MVTYPVVLGFDTARAAHWARRTRDLVTAVVTGTHLIGDLLTGRLAEVWVGDSHSVHAHRRGTTANFVRGGPGIYVVHLGSRLMYSVARKGLPVWAQRLLRLIARASPRTVPMLVCLGEIDVRCHLAKHGSPGHWQLDFVTAFVDSFTLRAGTLGYAPLVFVVPPPPCRDHMSVGHLPVVGDFATRLAAFEALRAELSGRCSAARGDVRCVDVTPALFDAGNGIREDLTDDQCHLNRSGASLLRGGIDAVLDARP